jgi:uncharacterized protein YegP (UPF0339 family)
MEFQEKILVVDDEPGIRDLICDALNMSNFKTYQSPDGLSALSSIRRDRFDLLILDINMKQYEFVVYKDKQGQYRFKIMAPNGRIVADSGEGYKTKYYCLKNIGKLQKMLADAKVTSE